MSVTLLAKRVRNVASSMAESPPPITAISLPEKKKPSQVAQDETPCPMSACSLGRPNQRAEAPLAMINVRVWITSLPMVNSTGRLLRSALTTCPTRYSAPKRVACLRMFSTSSGPWMPSGNPGKFSTDVVMESWPPGSWPSMISGLRLARAL